MRSLFLILLAGSSFATAQVHTTWLWHLQQPIYWPDASAANPYHYQSVWESEMLKSTGGNIYGDGVAHPTNNLFDIFSKADRVAAYQYRTKDAVQTLLGLPEAGAQVNYSGCLMENVSGLADNNQWGYSPGWEGNFSTARGWTTSGGFPRMDVVGFSYHHVLSPLVSEEVLRKQIQAHKHVYAQNFGTSPPYSKGYWPAECSFSERIIKVLVEEGFEWSVVANSHIARTLADYPLTFGTSGTNYDPPNAADITPLTGGNWWNGQIDGRGGSFAAPICYQPHHARHVDPATGTEYKMIVVPMADLLSYQDGFATMGTSDIAAHIAPFDDPLRPSLILMAHDGDNAYGGGYSYYLESVPGFASAASGAGYIPTTIQQYLNDHPVPSSDIVHIEDGSWVNAANDWGHPQFINWMWPQYTSAHAFDPNGWTEDVRNWAVLTAAENHVRMAEDLAGSVDIDDIVNPGPSSSNAELAWHFLMPGYTSGYMYYGTSLDMEVKQSLAANNAKAFADLEIATHPGSDVTPPSVFIPQRYPYNPGGTGFGPNYGYSTFSNPSDFHVWTMAYDVSGLASVSLKYREDIDGVNALTNDHNETYAGGSGVAAWQSLAMSERIMPVGNITGNPDIDFFVLPDAIANQFSAQITGLSETLVDYYVEAMDNFGNIYRSPIQHVYVGASTPVGGGSATVDWSPDTPTEDSLITITVENANQAANLHWGLTIGGASWQGPATAYQPSGTLPWPSSDAVESPMNGPDADGNLTLQLGPFNDPLQLPQRLDFVIHYADGTWDNNGGSDYHINIDGSVGPPAGVSWLPVSPTSAETVTVTVGGATGAAQLHWGVTSAGTVWQTPISAYRPAGSTVFGGSGPAVESPMTGPGLDGALTIALGPFDDPSQPVEAVNFVIHYNDDSWDNNGGLDYQIAIAAASCTPPLNLASNVTSATTAQLSWEAVPEASQILLQGRRVGGGVQQIFLPATATSFNVGGLIASSVYQWRLQSQCGGEISDFTAIQSFATPAPRANADLRMSMWPNPTSDLIHVQIRGSAEGAVGLVLVAADGREVSRVQTDESGFATLDLRALAAGIYVIRTLGGPGIARTLIKD